MLIYSQCKCLNYPMPYQYMLKQYDSVNEMHYIGNENWRTNFAKIIEWLRRIIYQCDMQSVCLYNDVCRPS